LKNAIVLVTVWSMKRKISAGITGGTNQEAPAFFRIAAIGDLVGLVCFFDTH